MKRLERRLAGLGLPEGTIATGLGIAAAGVCAYGFLVVSGRALGPVRYSRLSVVWSASFLLGTGLFQPFEQEIARVLAVRSARGLAGRAAVARAALLGALLLLVVLAATLPFRAVLVRRFFDGDYSLGLAMIVALVALVLGYVGRGLLSGTRQFVRYGGLNAAEGLFRLLPAVLLSAIGVARTFPYALAFAIAPAVAAGAFAGLPFKRMKPGPPCDDDEMGAAAAKLVGASLFAQALLNLPVLASKFLATRAQAASVGRFTAAVILARVPVVLFAAVQAVLLPKLSALAALSEHREFRQLLRRLLMALAVIGSVATAGAWLFGGFALRLFFGREFVLKGGDLAFLAAAAAFYLAALAMAQALIALGALGRLIGAWCAGVLVGLAVVALGGPLLLRAELGFLAGCVMAFLAMALMVNRAVQVHRLPIGAGAPESQATGG